MPLKVIVSYDDTVNDRDALTLARRFADAGAAIALAYVRHAPHDERPAALLEEQSKAEQLLERGAQSIGAPDVARHVVIHASTGDGLWQLAEREQADVVVFGSDYRTAVGTVRPGTSAQRLLNGGPAAVAIAPAGLRSHPSGSTARVGVLADGDDDAAASTAQSLVEALGGSIVEPGSGPVDLLVVSSRPGAPAGRVALSAATEYAIETASGPVLVVPSGAALRFASSALAQA